MGVVIPAAAAAFVVRAIVHQWHDVRSSISHARVAWLVAGGLLAGAGMLAVAIPWRLALALLGVDAPFGPTLAWYFMGELGKYLPGGIWPVVGRAELARRGGIPRGPAYASVALSLGALYLAAMLLSALLLPLRFLHGGGTAWLAILLLLPIGLGLLHHRPLTWLVHRAERLMHREVGIVIPRWGASMRLVAAYLPSWLLIGTATWCIARAFAADASWLTIAPAAILSWVAGFVLVPVPGGVGVREAAFVALVGGSIPAGTRGTIAIAARLAFMLTDVVGAALGAAAWRRIGRRAVAVEESALPPGSEAVG